jgi:hypothetical protein
MESVENTCNELKNTFMDLVEIRSSVLILLESLKNKITKLKNIYEDFINQNDNTHNNTFIFGLDSLKFQSKLIDIEYDDMRRIFNAINNRMYCEYFKLYKIISEYINENIHNDKVEMVNMDNKFPIYKDLEPFKQYDFEILKEIHATILVLIARLNNYIINKEHELKIHRQKNKYGLNIDNFVTAFQYNIYTIREKMNLFISYLQYFHKLHSKNMKRFTNKVQLMNSQVVNDIKFDDDIQSTTSKKKALLKSMADEKVDKNLLMELKNSIHDRRLISQDSYDSFNISPSGTPPGLTHSPSLDSIIALENIYMEKHEIKEKSTIRKVVQDIISSVELESNMNKNI